MKDIINKINLKSSDILQISCNKKFAQLHKNKFANGNRGKCIFFENKWLSPNEFVQICGRSKWKDWKGCILFYGKPLRFLIHEGVLNPHSPSCLCFICSDNQLNSNVIFSKVYERKRAIKKPETSYSSDIILNTNINSNQPYDIDRLHSECEHINITNNQKSSSNINVKHWDLLANSINDMIEQGKRIKDTIEEMYTNEQRKHEEILREIEKQKIEEINAIRVEAQLHIYKMLLEQRHEKEIAVQEAIAEVRAELTKKIDC